MSTGDSLIYFDVDVFREALDAAVGDAQKATQQAIYSTMKLTRNHAKTKLSSLIRDKWNIHKSELDKRTIVKAIKGGVDYGTFEMTIKGTSVSLAYFAGTKQYSGAHVITAKLGRTRKNKSRFQGVQVQLLKSKNSPTKLAGAFLQVASNGHVMVMKRKGKGRYPVAVKASISPASMFGRDGLNYFEEDVIDYLEATFVHELEWRLSQAGLL